jgi:hypothetical protein
MSTNTEVKANIKNENKEAKNNETGNANKNPITDAANSTIETKTTLATATSNDEDDDDDSGNSNNSDDSVEEKEEQDSNADDEEESSEEESNSSDEDMDEPLPEKVVEEVKEEVVKKKGGFFSRLMSKTIVESSSSSSEESEDSIDLDDIDCETIEEAIEALKLVEEVDSDWDILLDAPSDWDSDDSENKPTAPVFRSTCGYLTIETTQLREDLLNDLLESRVLLEDAEKELQATEEDQYMKYYYETIAKLRDTRDKAAKRVKDEENRLALYSQKDSGVTQLASALRFNEHLLSLTLCDAEMTTSGAISLASAIKVHPTLTHLSCKHNPIGAEGAEALVRASRRNDVCGLKKLDLWDCKIGPEGALMIATQLYKDTSLEEVRLRFNQFGPIGGFAFAGCLMQNRVIQKLDLTLNDIEMNGALAFERVLKFTVAIDMTKETKLSPYKKLCKLCRSRIDNPFWEDELLMRRAEQLKADKKAAKLAAKNAKKKGGGDNIDESKKMDDGEEKDEEDAGNNDNSDESAKSGIEDSEESEDSEDSDDDDNGGSSTGEKEEGETKSAPRREGKRARRKRLKAEALKAKRIAENKKFWMASYLGTKERLEEQKKLLFSTSTKKKNYKLVLFAGTKLQCSRAIELMNDDEIGSAGSSRFHKNLVLCEPNSIVKEINLEGNNLERPFRNNVKMMKRLLGSRVTGVWQPVENFFKPTLRA